MAESIERIAAPNVDVSAEVNNAVRSQAVEIQAGNSSRSSVSDATLGSAPPATTSKSAIPKQTFVIGTRIEKVFEVDGVSQAFGGNVALYELLKTRMVLDRGGT